jgi:GTPase
LPDSQNQPESAICIGAAVKSEPEDEVEQSLIELGSLARTAGADVVQSITCILKSYRSSTLIGKGKLADIAKIVAEQDVQTVLFDNELSPAQQANLERELKVKVVDRTGLILDIFASRARTLEGKLQVELAQLNYILPRLTGMWSHLGRQNGGIGTRGPGETQLEVDRRRIRQQIARLRPRLEKVRRTRLLHRAKRKAVPFPIAALVGYTNAGKSTLFNRLTGANVLIEDKLFATLDPTTRLLNLPAVGQVLLTDTVGFINRLPTMLVEAFKATLEEVAEADLIVHVIDAANAGVEKQVEVVEKTLTEIGCDGIPVLEVLNKVDLLEDRGVPRSPTGADVPAIVVSATTGEGIEQLVEEIDRLTAMSKIKVKVRLGHDRGDLSSAIRREGRLIAEEFDEAGVVIEALVPPKLAGLLAPFAVPEEGVPDEPELDKPRGSEI